jgi:1,4-alpha-glucan branching enzyme
MNDTLSYFSKDPVHRKFHHNEVTFSLVYAFSENFILPFSHDEVVHGKGSILGKMPGDDWQRFANVRLLYSYMYAHPGKKLLFMGNEIGQWNEWDAHGSLPWDLVEREPHRQLAGFIRDLNRCYRTCGALHQIDTGWEGFEWIDLHDSDNSILSFIRKGQRPGDHVVCVFNMTPVVRYGYRVGVSLPGGYREAINTDAAVFGGSDVCNPGVLEAEPVPWADKPHSLAISLPPLAGIYLRPES